MEQDTAQTTVIFRKFKDGDGDVIALFPEIADGYYRMLSCMHVGQHGAASVGITGWTRPAAPNEYADLKEELESLGYNLRSVKRMTARMAAVRAAQIKAGEESDVTD